MAKKYLAISENRKHQVERDLIADVSEEFFTHDPDATYYEFPDTDPETGDDVSIYQKFNEKGILDTAEAPSFRPVRRNWLVSSEDLSSGIDLSSLFLETPENPYAYLWLNGYRWFRIGDISTATDGPEGLAGPTFLAQKTANEYAEQWLNVPANGRLFWRFQTPDNSISPWREIITSDSAVLTDLIDDVANLQSRMTLVESDMGVVQSDIANIGLQIVDINASLAANIDQDTTTAFSRNSIVCDVRPQFVEIFEDDGQSYCQLSNEYIHGVVFADVPRGGVATIILPSVKIKGFSGLAPGEEYALDVPTRNIVIYDPESETQLYIGYAVTETEIEFPHDIPKRRKKNNLIPLELICQSESEAPDGETPLDLICISAKGDGVEPPPDPVGDVLIIGDLESATSSFSYYETDLTTSRKRPVIAFYARLNGVIVANGSDLQYSIDGGLTWSNCGRYFNYKHVAEGNVSALPLSIAFSSNYTLVVRLAINTSVVSNVLNVTTGAEPSAPEGDNVRKIIWSFGGGVDRPRSNGLWDLAYASGVRVMAGFDVNHWGKYERAENDYNFEELEYELEQHAAKGYQMIIWMKPQFAYSDSIQDITVHRKTLVAGVWNGQWNTISYSFASTCYLPSNTWERDRDGNEAAYISNNFKTDGQFSYASDYAVGRFEKLIARIAHLVATGSTRNGKPYSEIVHGMGIIDGGFNETSFNLQYRAPGGPTDLIYSDVSIAGYRTFLRNKYGNIHALNASWGTNFSDPGTPGGATNIGDQTAAFAQINKGNIEKPYTSGTFFNYWENNRVKDLWEYKVSLHTAFYTRMCNAIKNPSAVISGLSSSTGLLTFCYITENFTNNEGITYACAAMASMYSMFDGHFSSTLSDAPRYYGNALQDIAARMALFRGTYNKSRFGQEKDGDPAEAFIGYSRIFAVTRQYGGLYCCIALQLDPSYWSRPCFSIDGKQRTYAEDLKYTFDNYINNAIPPTLPALVTNVSYTERQALPNANNPNNILTNWKNAANPNSEGIVSSLVGMQCIDDLGTVDLIIDSGSVQTYAFGTGGGTYYWIGFNATINGQPINNGYAIQYTINGGTTWLQAGRLPGEKLVTHLSNIAPGSGTVSVKIRPAGVTSPVSNTVSILIPS